MTISAKFKASVQSWLDSSGTTQDSSDTTQNDFYQSAITQKLTPEEWEYFRGVLKEAQHYEKIEALLDTLININFTPAYIERARIIILKRNAQLTTDEASASSTSSSSSSDQAPPSTSATDENITNAVGLIEKAVELNDINAIRERIKYHLLGIGGPIDYKAATALHGQLVTLNDPLLFQETDEQKHNPTQRRIVDFAILINESMKESLLDFYNMKTTKPIGDAFSLFLLRKTREQGVENGFFSKKELRKQFLNTLIFTPEVKTILVHFDLFTRANKILAGESSLSRKTDSAFDNIFCNALRSGFSSCWGREFFNRLLVIKKDELAEHCNPRTLKKLIEQTADDKITLAKHFINDSEELSRCRISNADRQAFNSLHANEKIKPHYHYMTEDEIRGQKNFYDITIEDLKKYKDTALETVLGEEGCAIIEEKIKNMECIAAAVETTTVTSTINDELTPAAQRELQSRLDFFTTQIALLNTGIAKKGNHLGGESKEQIQEQVKTFQAIRTALEAYANNTTAVVDDLHSTCNGNGKLLKAIIEKVIQDVRDDSNSNTGFAKHFSETNVFAKWGLARKACSYLSPSRVEQFCTNILAAAQAFDDSSSVEFRHLPSAQLLKQ